MNALRHAETTMTPDEAEAIVRRLAERSTSGGPRVDDLAEALGVSREEVAETLGEIRASTEARLSRHVNRRRERRVWLLSGLAAVFIGGLAIGGARALHGGSDIVTRLVDHKSRKATTTPSVTYGTYGEGSYELFLNGEPIGNSMFVGERTSRLRDELIEWVDGALPQSTIRAVSREEDLASRRALQSGYWDGIVGIRFMPLEIRKGDEKGWLRWAGLSGTVPLYEGDDALVAEAVRAERNRRVMASLRDALGEPPPAR